MKKQIFTTLSVALLTGTMLFTSCKKDDVTAPIITLNGNAVVTSDLNTAYVDPGATAKDETTDNVTVTSDFATKFNKDLAGTYVITYSAKDEAGNEATATRTITVSNSAKNLAGSYSVAGVQNSPAATFSYTETITASSTTNNRILVTKFAGYSNANIYMVVSGTTIDVPAQTVLSGSPASNREFSGTGTISAAGVVTITYTEKTNGTTATGTLTHTKQ